MPGTKKNRYDHTIHNKAQLVRGGSDYFTLLEQLIRKANASIHLQTYIYDSDETGTIVADALIDAAQRGVKVYVLLDGYASGNISSELIERFKKSGVNISFFEPVFRSKSFYIGRRLHHKVFVADGRISLVGGINISNRYNDYNNTPAWLDWAVCAEGEVAGEIEQYCCKVWNNSIRRGGCEISERPPLQITEKCLIRIRVNDWINRKTQVYQNYMQLFSAAEEEVILLSSYFWPGRALLKKMFEASMRGVRIKLILAGVSDIKVAKSAERYIYRKLFKHHIEVYEYQKSVLHGKLAVADNQAVTIGSYNVNNISAYASMELNLDIRNDEFARKVTEKMNRIIQDDCKRITEENYLQTNSILRRFSYLLAYEFVHFIFRLFTFYFRQTKRLKEE